MKAVTSQRVPVESGTGKRPRTAPRAFGWPLRGRWALAVVVAGILAAGLAAHVLLEPETDNKVPSNGGGSLWSPGTEKELPTAVGKLERAWFTNDVGMFFFDKNSAIPGIKTVKRFLAVSFRTDSPYVGPWQVSDFTVVDGKGKERKAILVDIGGRDLYWHDIYGKPVVAFDADFRGARYTLIAGVSGTTVADACHPATESDDATDPAQLPR